MVDLAQSLSHQILQVALDISLVSVIVEVVDMVERGVVTPLGVMELAIASAQEAANLILRIDDVITGAEADEEPAGGSGGPPGGPVGGAWRWDAWWWHARRRRDAGGR